MKKFLSFLLVIAVVMSFGTIAMTSVSAEENDDLASVAANEDVEEVAAADDAVSVGAGTDVTDTGSSGKVYFIKPEKWSGTTVFCHIFEASGENTSFFGWQAKKEKCTEEGGKFAYDLSILDDSMAQLSGGLKSGENYNIMFSDSNGNETCTLMFNSNLIGDTAKPVDVDAPTFENNVDSSKKSWEISWTSNASKYGIPLIITSVGTVQGTFVEPGTKVSDLIKQWDKDYKQYPNSKDYSPQSSARDHKTRLAELQTQIDKLVAEGKILLIGGGVYTEASSSSSSSGDSSSDSSSDGSSSNDSSDGSSSDSSDGSSTGSSYTTSDGKKVTKDANGNFVDESGNVVDASDVVETENTVSTGESSTYVFVTLGVMLAAAGVFFLTRKKKA